MESEALKNLDICFQVAMLLKRKKNHHFRQISLAVLLAEEHFHFLAS